MSSTVFVMTRPAFSETGIGDLVTDACRSASIGVVAIVVYIS